MNNLYSYSIIRIKQHFYLLEINFWHYTYLTDSNLINVRSLIRKYGWEKLFKINKRTRTLIRVPRVRFMVYRGLFRTGSTGSVNPWIF